MTRCTSLAHPRHKTCLFRSAIFLTVWPPGYQLMYQHCGTICSVGALIIHVPCMQSFPGKPYGRGPADQHIGRSEEESSVVNARDVENAQDKHISGCWENVVSGSQSRNKRNLDDTLPTLFGRRNTPARTHIGQKNQEKIEQVHLDRRKVVQTRTHPPYPSMCKW